MYYTYTFSNNFNVIQSDLKGNIFVTFTHRLFPFLSVILFNQLFTLSAALVIKALKYTHVDAPD